MRVAIIGAGVAGLTAAYLLHRAHQIELFERDDRPGGHANTIAVDGPDGRELGLDTGFIVYNEPTYPGFTKLLRELHVTTRPGDMSLSVSCHACAMEYSSRGIGGMLADRRNLLRPARWTLGADILRFYRDARRAAREDASDETLGQFLRAHRYGGEFVRHFIVPLAAAVWSTPAGEAVSFPASYFLRFLANHGIIGLQPAFQWRTVNGGSRTYVRAMTDTFACRLRLDTPVRAVQRDADGVRLRLGDGTHRRYDAVVFACHADEALRLLGDAGCDERDALAGFRYTTNHAALHTDAAMLPRRPAARASWNYRTADCRQGGRALGMTYHLNRLQALDTPVDYCVSLNASGIRPHAIIREMSYDHPAYTFQTLAAQQAVARLQGQRGTYFAGAHLGYGFHEDGLQSGARVAAMLGVPL